MGGSGIQCNGAQVQATSAPLRIEAYTDAAFLIPWRPRYRDDVRAPLLRSTLTRW
jgi:hypothetical protein